MNTIKNKQPEVTIPGEVHVAEPEVNTLANGMKSYVMQWNDREVLRISFVFPAGSSWQQVPFSASATLNVLSEGSRNMTAAQIAEQLDFYGSYFDVNIDRDWAIVTFVCLAKFFEPTLRIAEEILLYPEFHEDEVRIYAEKSRQTLIINRTKVDYCAREAFAKALYGPKHPYGVSSDASMYDALKREDLQAFYKKHYTSAGSFVVMSGQVTGEMRRAVETMAEMLPAGGDHRRDFPGVEWQPHGFVHFDDAVQTSLRVGRVLFPRTDPDFMGMQVVATVLGGYFGSRLVRNLREERGYTYGAFSAMVNFDRSGYLAAATEVGAPVAEDALGQILFEMQRLRTDLVPQEELSLVKNIMVGELLRLLDGPFGIADVTIENIQNGVSNSYISDFVETIRSSTPQQVRDLAIKYLDPAHMTTVVAGSKDVR